MEVNEHQFTIKATHILFGRISKKKKFVSERIKLNEVGFHWELSNNSFFAERGISHIRKCSYGVIVSNYLKFMNMKVLEIAPRYARFIKKKQLELNNCEYYSLNASEREHKRGNTKTPGDFQVTKPIDLYAYTSQLDKLFEPNYFDVIIGSQCFEHWREIDICEKDNINAYDIGLNNCHKILKSGGVFMQDAPIGHHGEPLFLEGNLDGIKELFDPMKWTEIEITEWGKQFNLEAGRKEWVVFIKAKKI